MDIELLRDLCRGNRIKWTIHALKRIRERGISAEEVLRCVTQGQVIENYPDDRPFPSCLIHCVSDGKHLHAVVSSDGTEITIITAYIPNGDEWEDDYQTRKAVRP